MQHHYLVDIYDANLSGIAAVNNNANFAFRIVSTFTAGTNPGAYVAASAPGQLYDALGSRRFDMVTVTAVPEPGTVALMPARLAAGGWFDRRRQD